ncbi:ABC transporter permease [Candidatus Roizmanbacteria bacterium]|nr:ABC transporter permease [Candidatus Roizmanbacteria bacterium]
MRLYRILAILTEEFYITKRSFEVMMDLFFFAFVTVITFGFTTLYFLRESNQAFAYHLFLGLLLWEIIRVAQYTLSVGVLWEVWSRNLTNIFISPMSAKEYIAAEMFSGALKSLVVFITISLIALMFFGFNVYQVGLINIVLFFINLILFSWFTGIIILGLIFRYGTRIQALAWGFVFLFQPLTAAFFPVKILPKVLQNIAYFFPPTYVFEAARASFSNPGIIEWNLIGSAFLENIAYLVFSLLFFNVMFKKSKETGQFVKNEG